MRLITFLSSVHRIRAYYNFTQTWFIRNWIWQYNFSSINNIGNVHAAVSYEVFFIMHDISVGVINILFMPSALLAHFATVDLLCHFDEIKCPKSNKILLCIWFRLMISNYIKLLLSVDEILLLLTSTNHFWWSCWVNNNKLIMSLTRYFLSFLKK